MDDIFFDLNRVKFLKIGYECIILLNWNKSVNNVYNDIYNLCRVVLKFDINV